MRTLLLLAMLVAFGVNAQQNSNYILPYRTQTRMLQVLQVNPNVTRDSVLVRNENGWLGSTPFPTWSNLSGRPTFSAIAVSGAYNDLVGLPSVFPSSIANVTGLQTALNGKISVGANIPYSTLTGVPTSFPSTIGLVSGLQSELDGKQPVGNYLTSFTELDPTVPAFAKSLTGTTALRAITDPLYRPIGYVPTSAEITTSLGYTPYNGTTNPNGYITLSQVPSALVSSVNGKTGSVVITATDVGLGNVNNTSDANKPLSTATTNALSGKMNTVAYYNAAGTIPQPTKVWKARIAVTSSAMTIDLSSAGFTNVNNLIAHVDIERLGITPANAITRKIRSLSATTLIVDLYQPLAIVLGGLGMGALTEFTNTWLHITVEGD